MLQNAKLKKISSKSQKLDQLTRSISSKCNLDADQEAKLRDTLENDKALKNYITLKN
jgi:hypothetical protein